MGGGYYDRDVGSTDTSGGGFDYGSYTPAAQKAFSNSHLDDAVVPRGRTLTCGAKSPVVVAMDVTGSMGDWSKVIYDKMPMFFGQIMVQGYLQDPAISFCAVGDAYSDKAPIQVCDFAAGDKLDGWLTKLWLEGNGGGQDKESYNLAAYAYARHCELTAPEMPFFFFTGDEGIYPVVEKGHILQWFGVDEPDAKTSDVFAELNKKFHVFLVHKDYGSNDAKVVAQWKKVINPERILVLQDPKAVVDVMLGAIAVMAHARDLDAYLVDMRGRGQSQQRIDTVGQVLQPLAASTALVKVDTTNQLPVPTMEKKRKSRSRRL
jgi:hypothetical protein